MMGICSDEVNDSWYVFENLIQHFLNSIFSQVLENLIVQKNVITKNLVVLGLDLYW